MGICEILSLGLEDQAGDGLSPIVVFVPVSLRFRISAKNPSIHSAKNVISTAINDKWNMNSAVRLERQQKVNNPTFVKTI